MEKAGTFFTGQPFHPAAESVVLLCLRKIDVVEKSLYIKAGASGNNRQGTAGINILQSFPGLFLKHDDIKVAGRLQYINQMMGNSIHLFFCGFCGPDIHMPVNLHGISADNLSPNPFGKADGEGGFSYGRRACYYDYRFLHILFLLLSLLLFLHMRCCFRVENRYIVYIIKLCKLPIRFV